MNQCIEEHCKEKTVVSFNLISMKKFGCNFSKLLKLKQKNKSSKTESKLKSEVPCTDDLDTKEMVVPLEVEESQKQLMVPERSIIERAEISRRVPKLLVDGITHFTSSVEECLLCNAVKNDDAQSLVCYTNEKEDILPMNFITSVDQKFSDVPVAVRRRFQETVLLEVQQEYPPYYDFCVISSEDDYALANEFKLLVCKAFSLSGCMINDGFMRLGAEYFECYENMIDHSTKVFFFITERFNENNFCRRIQSAAIFNSLMSRAKREREKCVPVYPNGVCRVPFCITGLTGIMPRNHDTLTQSLTTTYSDALRQQSALQNERNMQVRSILYFERFQKQIENHRIELEALQRRMLDNTLETQQKKMIHSKNCNVAIMFDEAASDSNYSATKSELQLVDCASAVSTNEPTVRLHESELNTFSSVSELHSSVSDDKLLNANCDLSSSKSSELCSSPSDDKLLNVNYNHSNSKLLDYVSAKSSNSVSEESIPVKSKLPSKAPPHKVYRKKRKPKLPTGVQPSCNKTIHITGEAVHYGNNITVNVFKQNFDLKDLNMGIFGHEGISDSERNSDYSDETNSDLEVKEDPKLLTKNSDR